MTKLFIKNRKKQKIAVIIDKPLNSKKQKGLAFVMHGLGGFKEQPHIQAFAEAFREQDYLVVRFDTTNSIGESDGKFEDATITNYYDDLEDVINWAKKQEWYQQPFCLAGHSLGGISTALYAENHPIEVKALAPISTVVSGNLSLEAHPKSELDEWKKTGWQIKPSTSKPGIIKKLKWSHMENRVKYDLLPKASKLTMPVILIVGSEDTGTPIKHQKILFDKLPGKKEIYVIKGAPHTFREKKHVAEVKKIMSDWIKRLN
jgi:pimeloyl-ACP methyl ester carboxylesterase